MPERAIVRKPGHNFADGITPGDWGKPNYSLALKQHDAYCRVLKKCGLELIVLEADPIYPDGCFVEDTAIVTEECAIITRPGAEVRRGEEDIIREIISGYKKIESIQAPGTVDGGDILRVENHFYIGLSNRTNQKGAHQLQTILNQYGYSSSFIPVGYILHLKSGVSYIGQQRVLSISSFTSFFEDYEVIQVDDHESYAANCITVHGHLLLPKGFHGVKSKLEKIAYSVLEIDMSEFQKMDGGLTCLSIIF